MQPNRFNKSPEELLDYELDFRALTNGVPGAKSDYLASGETIVGFSVTPADGISVANEVLTKADSCVQIWLSGGVLGKTYPVSVEVETNVGRIADRSVKIKIVNR